MYNVRGVPVNCREAALAELTMASTVEPFGSVVTRSPAKSGNKTIPPSPKYSESRNRQKNKNSPKKSNEVSSSVHRNSDNFSRDVNTVSSSNRNDTTKGQRMQNKKGKKTGDSKIKMKFLNCMKYMKSWLFWFSIIVAVVAILYKKSIDNLNYVNAKQELLASVGEAGLNLFGQYDLDEDGYLSLSEFIPITHRLIDVRVSGILYSPYTSRTLNAPLNTHSHTVSHSSTQSWLGPIEL